MSSFLKDVPSDLCLYSQNDEYLENDSLSLNFIKNTYCHCSVCDNGDFVVSYDNYGSFELASIEDSKDDEFVFKHWKTSDSSQVCGMNAHEITNNHTCSNATVIRQRCRLFKQDNRIVLQCTDGKLFNRSHWWEPVKDESDDKQDGKEDDVNGDTLQTSIQ